MMRELQAGTGPGPSDMDEGRVVGREAGTDGAGRAGQRGTTSSGSDARAMRPAGVPGAAGEGSAAAGATGPDPARVVDFEAWKERREQLPGRHRTAGPGDQEAGMATAEYAIATLAAVAFAALLAAVLGSGEVRGMLMSLIQSALSFG